MSVVRHVEIAGYKIEDGSIASSDLRLSIERGTGTPVPVTPGSYIVFATTFGTPPMVDAIHVGPFSGAGTLTKANTTRLTVGTVRSGSFRWSGSPRGRAKWRAIGWRAGPSSP